jgi:hypothetical protein
LSSLSFTLAGAMPCYCPAVCNCALLLVASAPLCGHCMRCSFTLGGVLSRSTWLHSMAGVASAQTGIVDTSSTLASRCLSGPGKLDATKLAELVQASIKASMDQPSRPGPTYLRIPDQLGRGGQHIGPPNGQARACSVCCLAKGVALAVAERRALVQHHLGARGAAASGTCSQGAERSPCCEPAAVDVAASAGAGCHAWTVVMTIVTMHLMVLWQKRHAWSHYHPCLVTLSPLPGHTTTPAVEPQGSQGWRHT